MTRKSISKLKKFQLPQAVSGRIQAGLFPEQAPEAPDDGKRPRVIIVDC